MDNLLFSLFVKEQGTQQNQMSLNYFFQLFDSNGSAYMFVISRHASWLLSNPVTGRVYLKDRSAQVHRLVGLVVKASASRAEGPGFESRLRRDFFGVESYQ